MEQKILIEITMADLEKSFKKICTETLDAIVRETLIEQNEKLITSKEVKSILGITLPTVYAWTEKGILTPIYLGRKKYYKRSEIFHERDERLKTNKKKGGNNVR